MYVTNFIMNFKILKRTLVYSVSFHRLEHFLFLFCNFYSVLCIIWNWLSTWLYLSTWHAGLWKVSSSSWRWRCEFQSRFCHLLAESSQIKLLNFSLLIHKVKVINNSLLILNSDYTCIPYLMFPINMGTYYIWIKKIKKQYVLKHHLKP